MAKLDAAQIAFRAPADLVEAIDREVERLAAERPGEEVTRSDVVRAILHRTLLGEAEPKAKGGKPARKPRGK